ncbi:MAG: DUF3015 family protein [Nitrospira sp.]|nr:DUF3015 family protein [Nitrospira sp.]
MKTATSMKNLGLGLCVVAAGFMVGGCNTTKATVDTTVNFFSSTSPNGLFSADGMVLKEQKINLFAGVAYENLRHEAAAGGGQYVSALASLYEIPAARQGEFAGAAAQTRRLICGGPGGRSHSASEDGQRLNRELVAASLLP